MGRIIWVQAYRSDTPFPLWLLWHWHSGLRSQSLGYRTGHARAIQSILRPHPACDPELPIEFFENRGIGVVDCVSSHKNIEMTIGREQMEGVVLLAVAVTPFKGCHLAFVEKTAIPATRQKRETCICLRCLRAEVGWQFCKPFKRDHIALSYATGHLLEKQQGHIAELVFKPLVCSVIEMLVSPQGREARPVGKTHLLANRIVALVMRQIHKESDQLRHQCRGLQSPLRIEVIGHHFQHGNGYIEFKHRPGRHNWM